MTKEDRERMLKKYLYVSSHNELILKDICGRLPYGVIGLIHKANGSDYNIRIVGGDIDLFSHNFITIKPYLRSMKSMTEEEKETYHNLCYEEEREEYEFGEWVTRVYHDTIESIDYLNSIHVDYRDMIPKGLAIEVNEQNNPYKD